MALVLADRVRESTNTTGTGTVTLTGAVTGFASFADQIGNGNTTYYTITDGTNWEVGVGTYNTNTLSRDTVLDSSTGSKINFTAGLKDVFVTLPAEKVATIDTAVTSVTATAPVTSSGGTTPNIALTTSGANSVVLRDANQNITTNCLFEGFTSQAASGTTIVLIASSVQNWQITGSGGQVIRLPNATTLPSGATFTFNNNQSSGAITVQNNSSTTVATINSGGYVTVVLLDNSIAAGSWDRHDSTPSNVSWSTNTLDYPGSITSATWNGTAVAINRGGTGASTKATAFNALSPMSAAGDTIYGGTSGAGTALAIGTAGQVLTVNSGATAPQWSTPTTGTVTSVNGTGTVSGISLSGTVTSSGNLTLGGTLDLSSPPAIGSTAASTGAFTTLSASSTVSGAGFSTYLASPPAIGGTAAAAGTFTTLIGGSGSANYEQITGGATGKAVQFQSLGSDAAVSLAIQSKGTTGAIDLAAGSSGVNISNGGTVTAITITSGGSGYTGIASLAISAPTTAGGVQATATTAMQLSTYTIASGGTGYTVGDSISVVGGTNTGAITYTVATVSSGVVTGLTQTSAGNYTVLPTSPVSTTGGTGTGLTLNLLTWSVRASSGITITNAGSGYVEQPTVTFSGGGGSGAAAYASVGGGTIIRALGSTGSQSLDFYTPAGINTGIPNFRIRDTTGDSYWQSSNQAGSAILTSNNSAMFIANSTGFLDFKTGGGNQYNQLRVSNTTSSVNYVQVTGATTATKVVAISAQGSDTDVSLALIPKGLGIVLMNQQTPTAVTATGTLTIANLLTQIITSTSAVAVALTLPTGTLSDAGVSGGTSAVNTSFDWSIINTGSAVGDVTLVAGTGHTIVGSATVPVGTSGRFRSRKTATNTFVSYRI
jgi:hypothetical protein